MTPYPVCIKLGPWVPISNHACHSCVAQGLKDHRFQGGTMNRKKNPHPGAANAKPSVPVVSSAKTFKERYAAVIPERRALAEMRIQKGEGE